MNTSDNRPVNLNLFKFHFPIPALISIGHRISGVVLFLGMPLVLWMFDHSLASSNSFYDLSWLLSLVSFKLLLFLFIAALIYHFCAGVRHLLMDIGFGETFTGARISSIFVLVFFSALLISTGVLLW